MKLAVQQGALIASPDLPIAVKRAGLRQAVISGQDLGFPIRVCTCDSLPQRLAFNEDADPGDVDEVIQGDRGYPVPSLLFVPDKAIGHQPGKRLPHRRARDPESLAERSYAQFRPRHDTPVDYVFTY